MALIIEDGSIVANANSYVTIAETRDYASSRGYALPVDDNEVEALLIKAIDYLEAQRSRYQGTKTDPNQPLQWPRTGVYIDCVEIGSNTIPKELKSAQMQLAIEQNEGINILPTQSGPFVKKEKVDVIETEYSESVNTSTTPSMNAVDALLEPLFYSCGQTSALSTIRV